MIHIYLNFCSSTLLKKVYRLERWTEDMNRDVNLFRGANRECFTNSLSCGSSFVDSFAVPYCSYYDLATQDLIDYFYNLLFGVTVIR